MLCLQEFSRDEDDNNVLAMSPIFRSYFDSTVYADHNSIIMSFSDYYVTTISELFLHLIVGCVIIVRWWLGDGPIDGFLTFLIH